jgi:hypothetical protein
MRPLMSIELFGDSLPPISGLVPARAEGRGKCPAGV